MSCDSHLFNSQHSFHVFSGVSHGYTSEAAIPVDHIVVDIASNETQHVLQIGLELSQNGLWDSGLS